MPGKLRLKSIRLSLLLLSTFVASWYCREASASLVELLVLDRDSLKPVALKEAFVEAKIDGYTMKTNYELTFENRFRNVQEGTFYFNLPRGAIVDEFGLWVNGVYQNSAIVKAREARVAYESIVRRGVDPALLEWTSGNVFKMRVFPVFPNQQTKIKLTLLNQIVGADGQARFSFPLGFRALDRLEVDISGEFANGNRPQLKGLRDFKLSLSRKNIMFGGTQFSGRKVYEKPQAPPTEVSLTFPLEDTSKPSVQFEERDGERYLEMNSFIKLKPMPRTPADSALIIWDNSLSEEKNHEDRLEHLQRYLSVRKPKNIQLVRFANKVDTSTSPMNGSDFNAIKRKIEARPYDGATRIDRLVRTLPELLGKRGTFSDVVVYTNAVDSFEFEDFTTKALLLSAPENSFIVTSRVGSNETILRVLSQALGATVIDQEQEEDSRVLREVPWMITSMNSASGIRSIQCSPEGFLFSGDLLSCRGKFKREGKNNINVDLSRGKESQTLKFDFAIANSPVDNRFAISKRWAQARISDLLAEKKQNNKEIEELSLKHQLMSPFVARVVLEACEDYDEFNLPRPETCENRERPLLRPDNRPRVMNKSPIFEDPDISDVMPIDGQEDSVSTDSAAEASSQAQSQDITSTEDARHEGSRNSNVSGNPPKMVVVFDGYNEETAQFDFERVLTDAAGKGDAALEDTYYRKRKFYRENPYYFFFAAHQFLRLKNTDRAAEVLSNVVENRPSDARWLRVYGRELLNWGPVDEAVAVFAEVIQLREEEPHSYRDHALALEKAGRLGEALRQLEVVDSGTWDNRLEAIKTLVKSDLDRVSRKLLSQNSTKEQGAKAKRHVFANDERPLITATIFWDSDNTNIDLHVYSEGGREIFKTNSSQADQEAVGKNSMEGYGPDFYRFGRPYKGEYKFVAKYASGNRNVTRDGTFVWSEFTVIENGQETLFRKTHFLRDQGAEQTLHILQYNDKRALKRPETAYTIIDKARKLMTQRNFVDMRKLLVNADTTQYSDDAEATAELNFLRGYAEGQLKNYTEAIRFSQFAKQSGVYRFVHLADYNSACYAALSGNKKRALKYLEQMRLSLMQYDSKKERQRFIRLMKTDEDLKSIRGDQKFKNLIDALSQEKQYIEDDDQLE